MKAEKDIHVSCLHSNVSLSPPLCEWSMYGCKLVRAIRVSHSVRQ